LVPGRCDENGSRTMRTMTYLKDFVALSVFFTAGYVWLVIA
jgi:hypothetical protein